MSSFPPQLAPSEKLSEMPSRYAERKTWKPVKLWSVHLRPPSTKCCQLFLPEPLHGTTWSALQTTSLKVFLPISCLASAVIKLWLKLRPLNSTSSHHQLKKMLLTILRL